MRGGFVLGLLVGLLLGVLVALSTVTFLDGWYDYRPVSGLSQEEQQQILQRGTRCQPLDAGQVVWLRCPRLRLGP